MTLSSAWGIRSTPTRVNTRIVDRTVIPDTPVRVEYSLTKKGRALAAAMDAIVDWAEKWVDAPASAQKVRRLKRGA
jgi:DNA-binding HxlR family transcriptional regulator